MSNQLAVKEKTSMEKYIVAIKFHLGEITRDLYKGTRVSFDGHTALINNSEEIIAPSLNSAVKANWMILLEDAPKELIEGDKEEKVEKVSKEQPDIIFEDSQVVGSATRDKKDSPELGKTTDKESKKLKVEMSVDENIVASTNISTEERKRNAEEYNKNLHKKLAGGEFDTKNINDPHNLPEDSSEKEGIKGVRSM